MCGYLHTVGSWRAVFCLILLYLFSLLTHITIVTTQNWEAGERKREGSEWLVQEDGMREEQGGREGGKRERERERAK